MIHLADIAVSSIGTDYPYNTQAKVKCKKCFKYGQLFQNLQEIDSILLGLDDNIRYFSERKEKIDIFNANQLWKASSNRNVRRLLPETS